MWALIENNEIKSIFNNAKSLTINEVKYPPNIFGSWSLEELAELGIYEVIQDTTNYKNKEYWINTEQSFNWDGSEVTASYGEATARDLENSTDPETGVVTYGLKYNHSKIIDNQAYSFLQPNDWYVIRKQEADIDIPDDWSTYRSAVRSTADDMKEKINACSTVEQLEELYIYNEDEPSTRPLGEWPEAPDQE
tara:strand:+ start:172 stop:750 length:579 start_codon:yes stop_codon:yes gene_type:complete